MKRFFTVLAAIIFTTGLMAQSNWKVYNTSNSNISSNKVFSVCACNDQIAVGTNKGVSISSSMTSWMTYPIQSQTINDIEIRGIYNEGSVVWASTYGQGLYKASTNPDQDRISQFTYSNSGLPTDYLTEVTKDKLGNVWVGTWGYGLVKYDGATWTVYNTQNSGLPSDIVSSVHVTHNGDVMVGTYNKGFALYDGSQWAVYNTVNYPLPSDEVKSVYMDGKDVMWVGTGNGLVRYDGANWNVYNSQTTYLHFSAVNDAAADEDGNIWFATNRGLGKIDTSFNMVMFRTDNSGLPQNYVHDIQIDQENNIWIATQDGGLAVYNEAGLTLDAEELAEEPNGVQLHVFPNPSNGSIHINGKIKDDEFSTLRIYDQSGRVVIETEPVMQNAQTVDMELDLSDLATGLYMVELSGKQSLKREKLVVI